MIHSEKMDKSNIIKPENTNKSNMVHPDLNLYMSYNMLAHPSKGEMTIV